MTQPQVSVILPVFNGAAFLRDAIDSVIRQSLQPIELIIVDDGSTDDSAELAERIETPFPKRILFQENKRQSAARNMAAEVATGTYLAFLDHDDIWYTHHLDRMIALMEADTRLGWVYTDMDEIDRNGGLIALRIIGALNPAAEHPKTNLINMLSGDMYVFPSVCAVRRDAFLEVGGFDERLSGYEDDDLYLRMFQAGWLNDFIPESGARYRRYTGSSAFSERMWISREIFAQKLLETYPDDPELVRYYVRDVIAPRFFFHAKEEYWRHFPHRRWDLCLRSHELMRRFSDLSHLPFGMRRLRRFIGLQILARPKLFEYMYPFLRRFAGLPRLIMQNAEQ